MSSGKLKIEWAGQYMPVLAAIRKQFVKEKPFEEIWRAAPELIRLRQAAELSGPCGRCAYQAVCGGCRARAYDSLGDSMATDPICWFGDGQTR